MPRHRQQRPRQSSRKLGTHEQGSAGTGMGQESDLSAEEGLDREKRELEKTALCGRYPQAAGRCSFGTYWKMQKTQNWKATEGPGLGSPGSVALGSGVPDKETLWFGNN